MTDNRIVIEDIVGRPLTDKEYEDMKIDWKVFCRNPRFYKESVVVDMVRLWLSDNNNKNIEGA